MESLFVFPTALIPTPTPTLTITAPPLVSANQGFTISGSLTYGTTDITSATISLQRSADGVAWNLIGTTTTDDSGNYSFINSESAAGTHQYQTTYAGNAPYIGATSRSVTVTVRPYASTSIFATTCSQTSSTYSAGTRIMVGASDGTNCGVVAETVQNGLVLGGGGHTIDYNYNNNTSAIVLSNNDTATTECAATIGNFVPGSFDIVWGTDTKTDSTLINYIVFGQPGTSVQWSQTTVPTTTSATVALVGEYTGIQITPATIPTTSSKAYSPTDSFTSSWTQITVPGA